MPKIKKLDMELKHLANQMINHEYNLCQIKGSDNFLIKNRIFNISFKIEERLDLPIMSRYSKSGELLTFKDFKEEQDLIQTGFCPHTDYFKYGHRDFQKKLRKTLQRDLKLIQPINEKSTKIHSKELGLKID